MDSKIQYSDSGCDTTCLFLHVPVFSKFIMGVVPSDPSSSSVRRYMGVTKCRAGEPWSRRVPRPPGPLHCVSSNPMLALWCHPLNHFHPEIYRVDQPISSSNLAKPRSSWVSDSDGAHNS